MESSFNSNLLVIARQARGLSQESLSHKIKITQGYLSKIENGLMIPNNDVVKKLSNILDFPISYFYESDRIYGQPLSVHSNNKPFSMTRKQQLGEGVLDIVNAQNNHHIMNISRLMRGVKWYEAELPLPYYDIDEYEGDTQEIAALVRRTWRIPRGPIKNLTEYIERAGILVIWCDFNGAVIDGMTLFVHNKSIPITILLNHSQPADRMRFTLAHELGHIVMHSIATAEMEKQANEFANAFLMPSADIRRDFGERVTLMRLAMLKPIWKVSMQALLMCAHSIGVIDDVQNASLWKQIYAKNIRRHEPASLDFPHELPTVFPKLLNIYSEDYKYSLEDFSKTLHMMPSYIEKLYWFADPSKRQRNNLRVVS
ncbi:MAG: XRE family transcriptional regulator [Desulfobaccales bacterium]